MTRVKQLCNWFTASLDAPTLINKTQKAVSSIGGRRNARKIWKHDKSPVGLKRSDYLKLPTVEPRLSHHQQKFWFQLKRCRTGGTLVSMGGAAPGSEDLDLDQNL